jgi:M6 family metalloprotease-like protein
MATQGKEGTHRNVRGRGMSGQQRPLFRFALRESRFHGMTIECRLSRSAWHVRWFAGLALAVSCGGASEPTKPVITQPAPVPVLSALTVSLVAPSIVVGSSTAATATARDQFGSTIATGQVTWTSSAIAVATVSSSGTVLGVGAGSATISAAVGSITASTPLTVTAPAVSIAQCKLPARFNGVGLGFPRVASRQKSVGDVRVPMVFVDFSDAVATRTPQNVFAIFSPVAENYYRAVSYGRMNLILEPSFVWRRMSKPTTGYGWSALTFDSHRAYIQEALNLASTLDYSSSDAAVIVSNPDAGAISNGPAFVGTTGLGVNAGGRTLLNATTSGRDLIGWGGYWLNHEMGHLMGLADLYAYTGTGNRFVGGFSLMGFIGGHAREYLGWERWLLGWVDDAQVFCAGSGTSDIVLSPIERIGGTKIAVIPTGTTTAVVVESRRAEGFDTNGAFTQGLLVYFIDTSIASGAGVVTVLPVNAADLNKGGAPLQPGLSLTHGGVTVNFVSSDANGDRVRVVR